ncbi:unnamed protein product [Hermetia illucens]|uniref:Uncharacterized protein n=1 Tax=Hermetia illucens TaxID=343691 RepID=A0A7R8V6H7_HERIL|nr:unnamed protein product [Hermetia illucens]
METATTFNEKLRDYRMADDVPTSLVAALSAPLGGVHDTIKLERIRKLDCGFSNVINLKRAALALEENWCDLNSCVCFNNSGSQKSFKRESGVQRLGTARRYSKVVVDGIGASESATTKGIVSLEAIIANDDEDIETLSFSALILNNITPLPAIGFDKSSIKHLSGVRLVDPRFNVPFPIDVRLGTDVYTSLLENGLIHRQPCAQKTKLGWVLFRAMNHAPSSAYQSLSLITTDELDKTLRRF